MSRESGLLLSSRLNESLTPPNSRPLQEGYAELEASQILKFVPASAIVSSDGAHAYPALIKKKYPWLKHSQVSHRRRQFTAAKGKHVAGMQCIDRTWAHLKRWSHRQGKNCKSVSTQHTSAHFWSDPFAWCFVHSIRCLNQQLMPSLAAACWARTG